MLSRCSIVIWRGHDVSALFTCYGFVIIYTTTFIWKDSGTRGRYVNRIIFRSTTKIQEYVIAIDSARINDIKCFKKWMRISIEFMINMEHAIDKYGINNEGTY